MTAEESARLAEAYRIPDALHENGAFGYVGSDFGQVPQRLVANGKDEAGRPTSSQALDTRALAQLKPIGAEEALEQASWLTELIGLTDLELNPKVSHAKLTLSDKAGRVDERAPAWTRRCRTPSSSPACPSPARARSCASPSALTAA